MKRPPMKDPIETVVEKALDLAGVEHARTADGLDFHLIKSGVAIECKQFYSERAVRQLANRPHVILIQGADAARAFATMINPVPIPAPRPLRRFGWTDAFMIVVFFVAMFGLLLSGLAMIRTYVILDDLAVVIRTTFQRPADVPPPVQVEQP